MSGSVYGRTGMFIFFSRILLLKFTVGTKIIADSEKCFLQLISEKVLILLRDRLCLELIIVSSNVQALLLLQDK